MPESRREIWCKPVTDSVEQITEALKVLPEADLETVREFVAFLLWKRLEQFSSAEVRAVQRLQDIDREDRWMTAVEADEEIDAAVFDRLKQRGYEIQIPAEEA